MGGIQSQTCLTDCIIDESPISTNNDWTLHHAESLEQGPMSVFVQTDDKSKAALNALGAGLMKYRHPSILKFVALTASGGRDCLVTEKVCPLSLVLAQETTQSIGLGLLEICQALQFLHEKGNVNHGNISSNAVFVSPSGRWRLGQLGQVQPVSLTTSQTSRDILALGMLISELLSGCDDESSLEFLNFVKANLLLPDLNRRPSINQVLSHQFFRQPYIIIFQFLKDITIKTESEKHEFFKSLVDELTQLPARVVGKHLTSLLLSRYVLMEEIARSHVIPRILQPNNSRRIFSHEEFEEFVVPEIRIMFLVYDTGIRLVLLEHFQHYAAFIDKTTLEDDILPALLLGLKDTNPKIVSQTLRALADLVPIIGPEVVIGKNRSKIFSDGSPNRQKSALMQVNQNPEVLELPITKLDERIPPIGAEGESVSSDVDEWDKWEDDGHTPVSKPAVNWSPKIDQVGDTARDIEVERSVQSDIDMLLKNVQDLDILKLGNTPKVKVKDEVDFFADMTPDIPSKMSELEKFQLELEKTKQVQTSKFVPAEFQDDDADEGDGWGNDELDW